MHRSTRRGRESSLSIGDAKVGVEIRKNSDGRLIVPRIYAIDGAPMNWHSKLI